MKVEIIYCEAGGGHKAATSALRDRLTSTMEWEVVTTNIFDIIDDRQICKRITGHLPEYAYNKALSSGLTFGFDLLLKGLQGLIRLTHSYVVAKLSSHWSQTQPDLVISVIPNFNKAIGQSLSVPFVTIITDLADYPPHFWMEPAVFNQHIVCGTSMLYTQAISAGIRSERLHYVSGMVLHDSYYRIQHKPNIDPVGLVMFGGSGSKQMINIARQLAHRKLVLICGNNQAIERALVEQNNPNHEVLGYVSNVASVMSRCDYFIGKPGPGSISEALHVGLPVIISSNFMTLPQERWNCVWVSESGVGKVVSSFSNIKKEVDDLVPTLDKYRRLVARNINRASLEIPHVLQAIINLKR